jgi:ActR/RegA family two-component response regulator
VNPATGSPTTVLILDDDVAFVFWLGEIFTESGYQAFPALHSRQAVSLAKKLARQVDVLVVNPKLRGAQHTLEVLAAAQPNLRVLLIHDRSSGAPPADSKHPVLERPAAWESISKPEWMIRVRKALMRAAAGQ